MLDQHTMYLKLGFEICKVRVFFMEEYKIRREHNFYTQHLLLAIIFEVHFHSNFAKVRNPNFKLSLDITNPF